MATAQLVAHTAHERALLILFASSCSALLGSAQTSRRRRFLFFVSCRWELFVWGLGTTAIAFS